MKFFTYLMIAFLLACTDQKLENPSRVSDFEASLTAKADPWFFLGNWEAYPPAGVESKSTRIWAKFVLNENNELAAFKGKELIADGSVSERYLEHAETLSLLNAEFQIVDENTMLWTLHGWYFHRLTPRVESPTAKDLEMLRKLGESIEALKNFFRSVGHAEERILHLIESEIKTWEGHALSSEQLNKIKILEDYVAVSKAAQRIIQNDLDALEDEILLGKLRQGLVQMADFIVDGSKCTVGFSDFGDIYSLLYGADLCTGEKLTNSGRAISAIAIIGGNASAIRKFVQDLGLPGVQLTELGKHVDEILDTSKTMGWGSKELEIISQTAASVERFGPHKIGDLHKLKLSGTNHTVAETFRSASYFKIKTKKPIKLYRVSSESQYLLGTYWSRIKPNGPLQAQLDLALDPKWNNKATNWVEVTVPSGTEIYEGAVSEIILRSDGKKIAMGNLLGGGNQVYIIGVLEAWITGKGVF